MTVTWCNCIRIEMLLLLQIQSKERLLRITPLATMETHHCSLWNIWIGVWFTQSINICFVAKSHFDFVCFDELFYLCNFPTRVSGMHEVIVHSISIEIYVHIWLYHECNSTLVGIWMGHQRFCRSETKFSSKKKIIVSSPKWSAYTSRSL